MKTLEMWISSLFVNLLQFPGKFLKFHQSEWCMEKPGNLKFYAPFHERTLIRSYPGGKFNKKRKEWNKAKSKVSTLDIQIGIKNIQF